MALSYDKLWNLMRANKMKKGELYTAAKLSQDTIKKLNNNEPVHIKYLMNVCKVFHCNIGDVVDVIEEE